MSTTEPENKQFQDSLRRDEVAQIAGLRHSGPQVAPSEAKDPGKGAAFFEQSGMKKTEAEPITRTTLVRRGRHIQLLDNPDIKRWHERLRRSSPVTADVRLRRLGLFCEQVHLTPLELAAKDPRTVTDIVDDEVTRMLGDGYAPGPATTSGYSPGYVKSAVTSVKSWLAYWDVGLTRKIRVPGADDPVTLADEKVPERAELTEILSLGGLKARTIKQLIAKSGIRPQVVGNYGGTDGLRLGDLPDLALSSSKAYFQIHPPMVVVRRPVSKSRRQYFVFLTWAAETTVLTYLNQRLSLGEALSTNSPVVSPDRSDRPFMRTVKVSQLVRDSIRPKFVHRPYVLRDYADTQLLQAEAAGFVPESFRTFWMGHKGKIDATYTVNKQRLPETMLQSMRDAFRKAEPYLDLEVKTEDESAKQRRDLMGKVAQISDEKLGKALELVARLAGNP